MVNYVNYRKIRIPFNFQQIDLPPVNMTVLILHERSERSERSEVKRYQKQA